jgi:hypothetical protein
MTTPQAILIIGGVLNILISSLAGYMLIWIRARDPLRKVSRYGIVSHTGAITNGVLLLGLSVAIPYTGFLPQINITIAVFEVLATMASDLRNVINWRHGFNDAIAEGTETSIRVRSLVNMIHLLNSAAILYGVTRTALGI